MNNADLVKRAAGLAHMLKLATEGQTHKTAGEDVIRPAVSALVASRRISPAQEGDFIAKFASDPSEVYGVLGAVCAQYTKLATEMFNLKKTVEDIQSLGGPVPSSHKVASEGAKKLTASQTFAKEMTE